jgi:putative membrane protein
MRNTLAAVFSRGIITAGAVVAALALHAGDDASKSSEHHTALKGSDTAAFVKEAANMNNAVIKAAQLASEKAQNSELKEYAQTLEKSHKKAQDKLEKIAQKHNVTLPTSLDKHCQEEITKLQGYSGAQFDKEFTKCAIQGHAMALHHLREASTQATDSDVKEYARDLVAEAKDHQEKARQVARAVGIDQATIASLERQPPEGVGTAGQSTTERGVGTPQTSDRDQDDESPGEP